MKKYLLCLAALLFAVASCSEKPEVENPEEIAPESTAAPVLHALFETNEIESKAGFTYDGSTYYDHYWTAGDHIYVFPKEDIYDIYNCTDAAAGTFSLVKDRTGSATPLDKVYAIYSSELFDNGNSIEDGYATMWTATPPYIATNFGWNYTVDGPDKNGAYGYYNILVAAADNIGDNLVFKSTVGWLKLQLKGTQKVKAITVQSVFDNIFPISMTEVYVTNMAGTPAFEYEEGLNGKDRKMSISAPYAQLNTTTATDFYIALPPCTMSKGFKVIVEFADGTTNSITTSEQSYQIKRNTVLKMPERTISTTISNLSSSGTANTYIVQSAGNKKFNASVKGCSGESVGTPVRAGVLWESYNTHETPSVGDIVKNVTYLDGYVYFNVPFTKKGNAVIAVYDSSDKVLWSWLIWVNDLEGLTTPDDLSSFVPGFKLMKYPLGQIASGERGLYFQWGRKDPFYFCDSSGVTEVKSTGSLTASTASVTVDSGIANPTTFYYPASYAWESTYNTGLWSDAAKTMHDPCPPGWKVVSASNLSAALAAGFNNGVNGTAIFNSGLSCIIYSADHLTYGPGMNRYWTSAARLGGVNVVTKAIDVDGVNLSVVDETGTSVGYQLRCEKL